jgi:EPS-associated MarR family transcriptional regulator
MQRSDSSVLPDELRYKLMRLLDANPQVSQREVARELGISLGRVNYCLRALIDKGWVKVSRFRGSTRKSAYAYLLTPRGVQEKARFTIRFLAAKTREYDSLRREIEEIRRDAARRAPR